MSFVCHIIVNLGLVNCSDSQIVTDLSVTRGGVMWDMEGRGNNASAVEEINSTVDYEVLHFPSTLVLKVILLPILS